MRNRVLSKTFVYVLLFLFSFLGIFCFGFFCGAKTEYGYYYTIAKFEKERLKMAKIETSLYREYQSPNRDSIKIYFSDFNVSDLCLAVDKRYLRDIDRFLTKNKNNWDIKQGKVNPNFRGKDNMTVLLWSLLTLTPGAVSDSIGYPVSEGQTEEEITKNIQMYLDDRIRCIERLLYYGADPNIKFMGRNIDFDTGLREGASFTFFSASRFCPNSQKIHINLLPAALRNGGNPNVVYNYYHATPIFAACNPSNSFGKEDPTRSIKGRYIGSIIGMRIFSSPYNVGLLIEAGADIEFRDKWQNTPLIAAAGGKNFDIVLMLLEAGADYTAENEDGENLAYFLYLAKHNNPKIDTPESIDPYYNKVIDFLKNKGYSLENAYVELGDKLKNLPKPPKEFNTTSDYDRRLFDPYADEWIQKRKTEQMNNNL